MFPNQWDIFHCSCFMMHIWEAISKTRASCFIGVSRKLIKALSLQPHAFISFLAFGNPNKTLALIFEILYQNHHPPILTICLQLHSHIPSAKIQQLRIISPFDLSTYQKLIRNLWDQDFKKFLLRYKHIYTGGYVIKPNTKLRLQILHHPLL